MQLMPNSTDDANEILQALNEEIALDLLPALVYVIVIMVIGILGNVIVVTIIFRLGILNPHYSLILELAAFDFINICVTMTSEIFYILYPLLITNNLSCRVGRYSSHTCTFGSSFTLIAIAVDRYVKICHPSLLPLDAKHNKRIFALILLVALLLSSPTAYVYEIRKFSAFQVQNVTIYGHECSSSDDPLKAKLHKVYAAVLFALYLLMFVLLVTIYCKVRSTVAQHSVYMGRALGRWRLGKTAALQIQPRISEAKRISDNILETESDSSSDSSSDISDSGSTVSENGSSEKIETRPPAGAKKEPALSSSSSLSMPSLSLAGSFPPLHCRRPSTSADASASDVRNIRPWNGNDLGEQTISQAETKLVSEPNVQKRTFHESRSKESSEASSSRIVESGASFDIVVNVAAKQHTPFSNVEQIHPQAAEEAQQEAVHDSATDIGFDDSQTDAIAKPQSKGGEEKVKDPLEVRSLNLQANNLSAYQETPANRIFGETYQETPANRIFGETYQETPANKNCNETDQDANKKYNAAGARLYSVFQSIKKPAYKTSSKLPVAAFCITAAFLISFVPYFAISIMQAIEKDFEKPLRGFVRALVKISHRSFLINSASNPLIYGALNYRFRIECVRFLKICCSCAQRRGRKI